MTQTDFYFWGLIGFIFLAGGLYAYVFFLKEQNKELSDILEAAFENEQRLADKLDIAHNCLKETNEDIQRNNKDLVFNNRIRVINTALNASKPEALEF